MSSLLISLRLIRWAKDRKCHRYSSCCILSCLDSASWPPQPLTNHPTLTSQDGFFSPAQVSIPIYHHLSTPSRMRPSLAAQSSEIAPSLTLYRFILSLHPALALSPQLQNRIYSLFDSNMREVSKGTSMTYTERSKREEMFDEATRFLILRETSGSASGSSKSPEPAAGGASTSDNLVAEERTQNMPGSLPPPPAMQSTSSGSMRKRNGAHRRSQEERDMGLDIEPDELVGYCSFRFDTEETLSSRDAEVVYWCVRFSLPISIHSSQGRDHGWALTTAMSYSLTSVPGSSVWPGG